MSELKKGMKREEFLTARDIVEALKRRVNIVLISILICTFVATIFAFCISKPKYESTVKIFAGKSEQIQSDYSDKELESYSSIMSTYIELIKTEDFMEKIINEVDLDVTPKELMESIQFITKLNTPILEIKYVSQDKNIAKEVVSTITEEFELSVKEIILNTYTKVIDTVKVTEMPRGRASKVVLGFLLGVLVGCGIVFVLEFLDDTVTKKEKLEELLPIPVLGQVPLKIEENKIKSVKHNKFKVKSIMEA